jgi:hypothetical protein
MHLSNSTMFEITMVEELTSSNHIEIIIVPLITLCSKGVKQSQTSWEADDSESNSNIAHTLGVPSSHSQATFGFSFRFMDQGHSPRLQRIALLCTCDCCNITWLVIIYIILSLKESGGYVHLLGRSVTRLAAYHIYGLWLVLSNA